MKILSKSDFHTLIFLDIDGTILDVRQRTNAKGLPVLIRKMERSGFRFGLNSNRSLKDVRPVIEKFSLSGPFILENGASILPRLGARPETDPSIPRNIPSILRKVLARAAKRRLRGYVLHYADTTALVRADKWPKGDHLFANKYRRFSASIHNRSNGRPSMRTAKTLAQELNRELSGLNIPLRATAHEHGNTVTIGSSRLDKRSGLRNLRKMYPRLRIIAIGNDESDARLRGEVDQLYAVANSTPGLKRIADGVSKKPLTAGVIEILGKIEKDRGERF